MTKFYLVRHAESEMNFSAAHLVCGRSEATSLSERGVTQARKLGGWIARNITEDLSLIASSPAQRAMDTVAIALVDTRFESQYIQTDDRLHEMSQGEAEGVERVKIYNAEILHQLDHGKAFALPGAESMHEVGDRMYEWMTEAADKYGDDASILAGTHGMAIRCLAGRIRGSSAYETRRLTVDNASVNMVNFNRQKPPTIRLNTSTQW